MVKIIKAAKKDSLEKEWQHLISIKYGKNKNWVEKCFRFKAVDDNRRTIGTVEGKYESGCVYVAALMTAENSRGKGVGTMLLKKVEEFGKKLGAHRIWLLTGENWLSNIFYKKLGFKRIARFPDFYFHKDFVVYTRLIHSEGGERSLK